MKCKSYSQHEKYKSSIMKVLTRVFVLFLLLSTGVGSVWAAGGVKIASPDKKLEVWVSVTPEGRLSYNVRSNGVGVLETSPLGIVVDGLDLGDGAKIVSKPVRTKIDETYPVLGSHPVAHNHANEAQIPVETSGKAFYLFVRVYNDGVAVRYSLPQNSKYINGETTAWNLPENTSKVAWAGFSQSYEDLSHVTPMAEVPQDATLMGPITFEVAGQYLSISEADCETFSDMAFIRKDNLFSVSFPFQNKGWDIPQESADKASVLHGTYRGEKVSPWRTTIIAKDLTALVNSDLLTNLCPVPEKGADFSWVKPGRCLWQWWSVGAPKYDDQKDWYDAAAKLEWEYYLVDDGWRYWSKEDKDQWDLLGEVIAYGKSVGVKSIVWVDSKEMREAEARRSYLEKIKALGADGIKIDFIPDATAGIMQWYTGAMQDCSELKLLLNFHGCVKPTGLVRTYPNGLTREAVRGNEYHMSRYNRVMPFDHFVSMPFTRLMAGSADVTPVMLDPKELTSAKYTWANQFAQTIVYLSPITHFCDQYKFYLESPMFDLFQEVPTVWDETRVLSCTTMGEVVAYARRKGDTWWVGVMNGEKEREVRIPLDFLDKSTKATFVYDNPQSNTSIDRREKVISPNEVLTVKMAQGGGFVARF